MNAIQHIIRMERGETSNSASPMWRCQTAEGERVNIFKHTDPAKNSFRLFDAAGYATDLIAMELNESLNWNMHPVAVELAKPDGSKWWEIVAVQPRPAGSIPDANVKPDPALHRKAAERWATSIFGVPLIIAVWDTETTGLGNQDEIVEIAIVDQFGDHIFSSLLKPSRMELITPTVTELTGITREMVQDAPTFAEAYPQICQALNGKIWLIYNAAFDMPMLERACMRAGLEPLRPIAATCVMERFAEWYGDWDFKRAAWINKPLSVACESFEIVPDGAHRALADAIATMHVVSAMAELDDGDE